MTLYREKIFVPLVCFTFQEINMIMTKINKKDQSSTGNNLLEQPNYDQYEVNKALAKVGKGAGVLFIATAIGLLFNFLIRIVIARFYTPLDYGLFNLFFTILSISVGIGLLGIDQGISRYIGYYLGSKEYEKIKSVEVIGLFTGSILGILFGISLFFSAQWIAPVFSNSLALVDYLRIAAIGVPFYILLHLLVSIFQGFQSIKEKIIFFDFGKNAIFLALSIFVGVLALPFIGIIWSMVIAIDSIAIILLIYYFKNRKYLMDETNKMLINFDIGKNILMFSLPLAFVVILDRTMAWADTLMIGYFATDEAVGFYNIAKPFSAFISEALRVALFIYTPLVAGLYAQKKFIENDRIYASITKWICFITLPLTLALFFFSEEIILLFFGKNYVLAAIPLKVLSISYFINNIMGPNGATLMAYGKTRFLMFATIAALIINIILNAFLIPTYGITGAAVATSISIISINGIRVYKLNKISGISSIKPDIIKTVMITVILGTLLWWTIQYIPIAQISKIAITVLGFYLVFLVTIYATHSVSKEDIQLLALIEKRIGVDCRLLKNLLKRGM